MTIFAKVEMYDANIYKYLRDIVWYIWRKLRGKNVGKSLRNVKIKKGKNFEN